jgi:hypothetical protein
MLFEPYLLWTDPCDIACQRDDPRSLELLLAAAPRGAHILFHCPGHDGRQFFAHVEQVQRSRPEVQFHLMANTRLELDEYRAAFSLPAGYAPASLFVNERCFDLLPGQHPDTDAVYVARFEPGVRQHCKRLLLASQVPSLRVVTFCLGRRHGFRRLFQATFPELCHASVNNEMLLDSHVARELNRSRVQLALSRQEGCMLAFTEGLLCGVPAVSTRCRSARTEFFNADDVLICEDDASSVARAVVEMLARAPERAAVRARALARLAVMREEYVAYIRALTGASASALMAHLFGHAAGSSRLSYALPRLPAPRANPHSARAGGRAPASASAHTRRARPRA